MSVALLIYYFQILSQTSCVAVSVHVPLLDLCLIGIKSAIPKFTLPSEPFPTHAGLSMPTGKASPVLMAGPWL